MLRFFYLEAVSGTIVSHVLDVVGLSGVGLCYGNFS